MKCISCQNEIQDGIINCPYCGTIQTVNNGVNVAPVSGAQPIQPVQGAVPVQPVQTVQPVQPGVAVPPVPPVQPVQPVTPQPVAQQVNTGTQPQALGTVSQRDAIAQGIQSGNLINGMYTADEVIDSKEHQNFVMEEKKDKKKKIILTSVFLIIVIGLIIGGFLFYKSQYKTSNKRIKAFFDVVKTEVNGVIKNDTTQKNNGDYKLNIKIDENEKQYGLVAEGKFAYDLSRLVDITANISSIKYGEELIEKDPISLELYLNDSKVYFNFQNFLDKYIYTDFDNLTEYKHNIAQNDVLYNLISSSFIQSLSDSFINTTSNQKMGKSSISGSTANIVSINMNSEQRKNFMKRFFERLEENPTFTEQVGKITGKDAKGIRDELDMILKNMKFDSDKTILIELHTALFKSKFIGLKVVVTGTNLNDSYIIKPIANGYSIKETKNSNQVLDIRYIKTKGATSTTRTTTRAISGTVYDGKVAKNIDISLEISSNVVVDIKDVKVKDSVKFTNLTEEDFNNFELRLDKYPKLKTIFAPTIETYKTFVLSSKTGECNGVDTNCTSDPMLNEGPTENTPEGEQIPQDTPTE